MKHSVRQTEQEFDLALKMMFAASDPSVIYTAADSVHTMSSMSALRARKQCCSDSLTSH